MMHDHEDITKVVIGCRACITRVRAQEEAERWATAPLRRVEFRCTYSSRTEGRKIVTFTCELGCPDGASVWEIDEQYADVVGEAFVMALPDSVPMVDTDYACISMEVEKVTVGNLVAPHPQTVSDDHPSLFEAHL